MSSNLTDNKNFLQPSNFVLTINRKDFPNSEYFCGAVTLPNVDINAAIANFRGNEYKEPGEQITYSPLNVRIIVTEDMDNYIEIFNWIMQNKSGAQALKADMILSILSSHNNVIRQIKFIDAFPISIGALDLDSQVTDDEPLLIDITFEYSYFNFI